MNKSDILNRLEELSKGTLMEAIKITYTDVGEDFISGKMQVNHLTKQPMGLLHGGATASLMETLGSIGTFLHLESTNLFAAGIELNVNHIRGIREGFVYGKAKAIHLGKSTHIWQIDVTNEEKKLIATGRLTMFIKEKSS